MTEQTAAPKFAREVKLLDHGYLKYVDHMGSDEAIVEAARTSTGRGFVSWEPYERCDVCDGWRLLLESGPGDVQHDEPAQAAVSCEHQWKKFPRGDQAILEYLYAHQHLTPFEIGGEMHVEVQAPILVFREWHRHRTFSFTETSARYVPLPDINYVPTVERLMMSSTTNKQASVAAGAYDLTAEMAEGYRGQLRLMYANQEAFYHQALKMGVTKELARCHLPVGRYSRMRAKTDLRNWLGFLLLRQAETAQWEIRQYAEAVADIIRSLWPRTYALYEEHARHAVRVGQTEALVLRETLDLLAPVSAPKTMPRLHVALSKI